MRRFTSRTSKRRRGKRRSPRASSRRQRALSACLSLVAGDGPAAQGQRPWCRRDRSCTVSMAVERPARRLCHGGHRQRAGLRATLPRPRHRAAAREGLEMRGRATRQGRGGEGGGGEVFEALKATLTRYLREYEILSMRYDRISMWIYIYIALIHNMYVLK